MAKEFHVDEELCTGCGDCYNALPTNFKDSGSDTALVHSTEVADLPALEKVMGDCPGQAILWKK